MRSDLLRLRLSHGEEERGSSQLQLLLVVVVAGAYTIFLLYASGRMSERRTHPHTEPRSKQETTVTNRPPGRLVGARAQGGRGGGGWR